MNAFVATRFGEENLEPTPRPIRAFVAYEDAAAHARARCLYENLTQALVDDFDFTSAWCAFDLLEEPEAAQNAFEAAVSADLVIFSAHAGATLRPQALRWLEKWLPLKSGQDSALVALIGLPGDTQRGWTPLQGYLRGIARRAGMGFLSPVIHSSEEDAVGSAGMIVERAGAMGATLSSILRRPVCSALPPQGEPRSA